MKNQPKNPPIAVAVDAMAGRWSAMVLSVLGERTLRFSEIKAAIPKVTPRMLTSALKGLEKKGLVKRKVYAVVPPKVEYSITEKGKTILPIVQAMSKWGEDHA